MLGSGRWRQGRENTRKTVHYPARRFGPCTPVGGRDLATLAHELACVQSVQSRGSPWARRRNRHLPQGLRTQGLPVPAVGRVEAARTCDLCSRYQSAHLIWPHNDPAKQILLQLKLDVWLRFMSWQPFILTLCLSLQYPTFSPWLKKVFYFMSFHIQCPCIKYPPPAMRRLFVLFRFKKYSNSYYNMWLIMLNIFSF